MNPDRSPRDGGVSAIGERMRGLRLLRDLTLNDVGRSLGLTAACISQWEKGRSLPRAEFLETLAEVLSTNVPYLVTGQGDPVACSIDVYAVSKSRDEIIRFARQNLAQALGLEMSEVDVQIRGQSVAA